MFQICQKVFGGFCIVPWTSRLNLPDRRANHPTLYSVCRPSSKTIAAQFGLPHARTSNTIAAWQDAGPSRVATSRSSDVSNRNRVTRHCSKHFLLLLLSHCSFRHSGRNWTAAGHQGLSRPTGGPDLSRL